jgi:cyclic pyranopterin phosphate synthase
MLRGGSTDEEIADQIRAAVMQKPFSHEFQTNPKKIVRIMASTGG